MSFKSIVNVVALSAIASASLVPLASTAEARDGRRPGGHFERHGSVKPGWDGPRRHAWGHDYGYRGHHSNRGRNVALGAFAAVLGIAIAAEAVRAHDDAYYDRY